MSATLVCRCGERLRAPDGPAGGPLTCPTCGGEVGPPGPEAAREDAGGESPGPILVRVRRRNYDPNRAPEAVWLSLDDGSIKRESKSAARAARSRRRWQLDTHWIDSLGYPGRALGLVAGLGAAQALVIALFARLLPAFRNGEVAPAERGMPFLLAGGAALLAAYTVGFLDCVLTASVAGEYRELRKPGYDLGLRSAVVWLACFLAGPVLPAAAAVWYFLSCGDLTALDKIILAELGIVAVGYWVLALLAVEEAGGLVGVSPSRVVALVGRLGFHAAPPLVLLPGLAFLLVWFTLNAAAEVHRSFLGGLVLLTPAWGGAIYLTAFLLRVLALQCFRTRPE
jgi:hypothetical protein